MPQTPQTLRSILNRHTAPAAAELVDRREDNVVQCHACAHECVIEPGKTGVCMVRTNQDGELRVPRGYVEGLAIDPIEKKPFFHVLPGAAALSFGMLGCNFRCQFCQNWCTAQALREDGLTAQIREIDAESAGRPGGAGKVRCRRQHLQRAADHHGVGGRHLRPGAAARDGMRLRLQRLRQPAGAALPPRRTRTCTRWT